jgi:hypothetical protein
MRTAFLITALLFIASLHLHAQVSDSLRVADSTRTAKETKRKIYSAPRKASILSAVLPGLGQAYNRKYWKIPVIYSIAGGLSYLYISNHEKYSFYRKNLKYLNDDDPSTVNETTYNTQDLIDLKKYYKKYSDFAVIGLGLLYVLNIIDANVDAHLRTFDVSDDLSLRLHPFLIPQSGSLRTGAGILICYKFK